MWHLSTFSDVTYFHKTWCETRFTHTQTHKHTPRVDVQGMASDYAKQATVGKIGMFGGVKQCKSMVVFEVFLFLNSALFGLGEKIPLFDLRAHLLKFHFLEDGKNVKTRKWKNMETCTETAKLLWRFVPLWCADLPPKWVEHICEHCDSWGLFILDKFSENQLISLLKFNIAPEKWWLEDYFPIGKVTFQGLC